MFLDNNQIPFRQVKLLNIIQGLLTEMHIHIPEAVGGSGSLVLCNTAVPDNTVMNPQSSDAMLLTLWPE